MENVENYNIRLQALPKFLSELDKIQDLQFNDIFEKNSLKHEEIKVRSSTDWFNRFSKLVSKMFTLKNTNIEQIKNNSIIFCSSEEFVKSFYLS